MYEPTVWPVTPTTNRDRPDGQLRERMCRHTGTAGIVVTLPFPARPACLPVLARLVVKNTTSSSRLYLARRMIESLAAALPGRTIHGAGDAAYSGKDLSGLDDRITWTTRLRAGAALYDLPPGPTGRRGRPRLKGGRLPALKILAARTAFTPVRVTRYGADMIAKLRRVLIAARYRPARPEQPTPAEIDTIRLAWEHPAA